MITLISKHITLKLLLTICTLLFFKSVYCQDVNYLTVNNYKYNLHLLGAGYIDSLFKSITIYQIDISTSLDNNSKNQQYFISYNQHLVIYNKKNIYLTNQFSLNTSYTNNEQFESYLFNIGLRITCGVYYNKLFVAVPVQLINYFPHYVNFKSDLYRDLNDVNSDGWQKKVSPKFNYGLLIGITPTMRWDFIFEIKRHSKTKNTRLNNSLNEYRLQLNYRIKQKK